LTSPLLRTATPRSAPRPSISPPALLHRRHDRRPKDGPLTAEALKGKTVGVQLATSYFDAAKKIPGVKEVKTYKADPEAFSALKAKKIDAWISDKFTSWKR
jgi:hypothetical protein